MSLWPLQQLANKDILKWYILQDSNLQLEANLKELCNQDIKV